MQQQWTISWWHCDMWWKVNFIWKLVTTSSVPGLRRSCKALPEAKHAPNKGHGHCLVVCCWSDLFQLPESQQNHYIWEVCSASCWDLPKTAMPTVGTGQQKGPSSSPQQCLTIQPMFQKLHELGYKVLPYPPYSPDLSTNRVPIFKHLHNFLQGKCYHNQQEAENAFQEFIESWSMDVYTTGINKLLSC